MEISTLKLKKKTSNVECLKHYVRREIFKTSVKNDHVFCVIQVMLGTHPHTSLSESLWTLTFCDRLAVELDPKLHVFKIKDQSAVLKKCRTKLDFADWKDYSDLYFTHTVTWYRMPGFRSLDIVLKDRHVGWENSKSCKSKFCYLDKVAEEFNLLKLLDPH